MASSKKIATVIIPEHNEGDQVNETLDSLLETSDHRFYNVVVVSDGSVKPPSLFGYQDTVKHIWYTDRRGVGAAFDIGSVAFDTPYLILMGSDVRFRDNGYMDKMLDNVASNVNKRSLICATNMGLNHVKTDVDDKSLRKRHGASIKFFLRREDLPKKSVHFRPGDKGQENYRNILEAKWMSKKVDGIYQIPCILGAFYGVNKEWYDHIKGFAGHRYWGTLEPFISLKSWFAGGDCKVDTDIETGHIYKLNMAKDDKYKPSHRTFPQDLLYNKIMACNVLFEDNEIDVFMDFLGNNDRLKLAKILIEKNKAQIRYLRQHMLRIKQMGLREFAKIWPFKYQELLLDESK